MCVCACVHVCVCVCVYVGEGMFQFALKLVLGSLLFHVFINSYCMQGSKTMVCYLYSNNSTGIVGMSCIFLFFIVCKGARLICYLYRNNSTGIVGMSCIFLFFIVCKGVRLWSAIYIATIARALSGCHASSCSSLYARELDYGLLFI